jgi:hypothetical protein
MAALGTLTVDDDDVEQGTILSFAYAADAEHVSDTNWVGLYRDPGGGPGEVASATYVYAPGPSGTAQISSGALTPGDYRAYYLYNDGYDVLAGPLSLTVRAAPEVAPPRYVGRFGDHLKGPAGIARDAKGRVWVADPPSRHVHLYDPKGRLVRVIGDRVLQDPQDVAFAGDTLYVVDAARQRVETFSPRGRHTGSIGSGTLLRPRGIEVAGGRLLVSDVGNNRVARFDLSSGAPAGEITANVHIPHGIAANGTGVWVVSSSRQFDGNCGVTSYTGDTPGVTLGYGQHSTFGGLSNPAHVTVGRTGLVLVSVPDFGFVSMFRPTGTFAAEFGTEGAGLLRQPQGLATDGAGLVFVADTGNRRIAIFREQ